MSKSLLATLILSLALPIAGMAQTASTGAAKPLEANPPGARSNAAPARGAARNGEITAAQRNERTERHLSALRTTLRITPAQMPQWENFAVATRENAAELHARFTERGTHLARLNAAENMADYAQISELHARQLVRLAASFTALYATFSPDQQRDADAYFRNRRAAGEAPTG